MESCSIRVLDASNDFGEFRISDSASMKRGVAILDGDEIRMP